MSVTETTRKKDLEEDEIEIRLESVLQFLKEGRWKIIRWTGVAFVLGLLFVFSKQNEYTATVTVMPELKTSAGSGGLGDLKSLAGLAGINLGNMSGNSEAIRPDLYPNIVQSIPFVLHLLNQYVTTTTDQKPQLLQTYLINQEKSGFLGSISKILGNDEVTAIEPLPINSPTLRLTRRQELLTQQVSTRVAADMDKKTGIITITARMPDAVVSATVARQTLDYLTAYVTDYRTGKARQQLQFLTKQVSNAQKRYETAELQLSSYRDRNRNLFLNTAKIEDQRLQADYLLAQTVYGDLLKQLEQARIKVQEESPIFQVLEPARVPLRKSGPNRTVILLAFTIFGTVLGLVALIIRHFLQKLPS